MSSALRIALLLETSGGGSGSHVLDLTRGLLQRGHDVTVFWAPGRAQADFVAELHAIEGATVRQVPMNRAVGPGDLTSWRLLARAVRAERPFDILHAHSSKAGALTRLLPRSIPGRRIYTPHAFRTMDPGIGRTKGLFYSRIERLLAPAAARIITVSQAEYDHARALGIAADRLRLVVNGVDLPASADRATARTEMGLAEADVAIGFIGRLDPQKDPLRFIAAATEAARTAPGAQAVVIGDGLLRAACESAAEGAPIRFLGWRDAPALIPGLDIFCMTSRYEAMPYTLIEALHGAVPIVTTAVGGATETVIDGENGFVLPVEAPASDIARAMGDIAGDPDRRAAFAQASLRLAQSRTIDTMITETLTVYHEALSR